MVDIRQTEQYANYLKREGWIVERIDNTNYFTRKLPLIGSVLKLQRPEKIDFNTIDRLCRKYRVFQIIVEPNNEHQVSSIKYQGYKLSKSPYLPSKTLQIDLTQSQKTISDHFKKDARQALRKIYDPERAKRVEGGDYITTKEYSSPSDIRKWRESWKKSVKFNRYVPSSESLINLRSSFPHNYSVFLASHNGSTSSPQVISGAIFLRTKDVAYYWYGFTDKEGRTSLSQYSLLYQGILWAKKTGCTVFDFEGIYDSRFPNKSWLGFTHFKCSFGGHEVEYPGCYTKFRLPV